MGPGKLLLDAQGSAEQLSSICALVGRSGRHRPSGLLSVRLLGMATLSMSWKRFVAK